MPYLVIDTSTKLLYLGLASDKHKKIATYQKTIERDHARYINQMLFELLQKAKLKITDLTHIIVGNGPGSYTGLRVCGTAAKVLAYTLNIPLYQISSFQLLSSGYKEKRLVCYDARRQRYFASLIDADGSELVLPALYESKDLPITGDIIKLELTSSKITSLVKVDFAKIDAHKISADSFDFVPNYCLLTEAERKLNGKND